MQDPTQGPGRVVEHLTADSVSGHAIDRAISAAGIVNWKIAVTILIAGLLVGAFVLFVLDWHAIKKAGGIKKWVNDVPIVQYRTIRLIWLSEGVVVVLTLAVVAHAVWPQVIGEVQTDMVYAIFAFLGFGQGMNVTAFIGKRATEDPVITATNAAIADPTVQPLVTSNRKTGERSITMVPSMSSTIPTTTDTTAAPVVLAPQASAPPESRPVITRDA